MYLSTYVRVCIIHKFQIYRWDEPKEVHPLNPSNIVQYSGQEAVEVFRLFHVNINSRIIRCLLYFPIPFPFAFKIAQRNFLSWIDPVFDSASLPKGRVNVVHTRCYEFMILLYKANFRVVYRISLVYVRIF